jgi:hypothetical protein
MLKANTGNYKTLGVLVGENLVILELNGEILVEFAISLNIHIKIE